MEIDEELEAVALQRQQFLQLLADGPRTRQEIQRALDISKATCHRIIRTFEENGVLRRADRGYALSELGALVATEVDEYTSRVRLAQRLDPLVRALDAADVDYDLDLFADAQITYAHPDDPARPIHQYLELYQQATVIRTVARTSFVPQLYLEEIFDRFFEGSPREGIVIYPKSAVLDRYEEYPEIHRRVAEEDMPLRYRVYDRSPFGLTVYDREYMALRAYDEETNALQLFVHTDDPEAVAWAEDVFDRYYRDSKPLAELDEFPEWAPETPLYEDILEDLHEIDG